MSQNDAYAIFLGHITPSRYREFRCISHFMDHGEHQRDRRAASIVECDKSIEAFEQLGRRFQYVRDFDELGHWRRKGDWALVSVELAKKALIPLLTPRTTVRSPYGLFWDITLRRNRATSRRTTLHRPAVLNRDGYRCVLCQKSSADGVELTLDHVIAFSCGGETTQENLVTLCKKCNGELGNKEHSQLFSVAKLHSGWDPEIFAPHVSHITRIAFMTAIYISNNILVSQCRESDLG